jgi:hypothetical protein
VLSWSRLPVGSSSNSAAGFCISVLNKASRCLSPVEQRDSCQSTASSGKPSCFSQPALIAVSKCSPTHSPHQWLSATTKATERRQSGAGRSEQRWASR